MEELPPQDIWLSGTENIHMISDLLESMDGVDQSIFSDPLRATGRTRKLALEYALLSLRVPESRIIIRDHFGTPAADETLQKMVMAVLDAIKVDYEVGKTQQAVRDPDSFTGTKVTGNLCWIRATPAKMK